MPHLAHFRHGSFNLRHVVAKWSPLLHIWHPPNTEEEDDASGLCTFLLKKLISVLFKAMTCFSIMVFEAPSSYSSLEVHMVFFQAHSNFVAAPINKSPHHTQLLDFWP